MNPPSDPNHPGPQGQNPDGQSPQPQGSPSGAYGQQGPAAQPGAYGQQSPLGYPSQSQGPGSGPYGAPDQPNPYTHRYGATNSSGNPEDTLTISGPGGGPETRERPKKRRTGLVVAAALLAGVLGGVGGAAGLDAVNGDNGVSGGGASSLNTTTSSATKKASNGTVEAVAQKVLPSTVQINVKGEGGGQASGGSGTGIIISENGQILTNNHVVESAEKGGTITVAFGDGSTAKAKIAGLDPVSDLGVIKAEGKSGLTPASLGSSGDLQVGQEVVAIGSPFGLESTVTSGIVSALNRPVSSSDGSGASSSVFPAIQTDAAINPGNSGGPLVDMNGNVVGINSAIRSNSGGGSGQAGSIGLGFAIPIDLAKNVASQLVQGDKVQHARLGITVGNALQSDGVTGVGAEVKEVTKGSAGAKAGLKPGDVITRLNDQAVSSSDALVAGIRGYQPGDKVALTYQRDGKAGKVDVVLDSDGGKLGG